MAKKAKKAKTAKKKKKAKKKQFLLSLNDADAIDRDVESSVAKAGEAPALHSSQPRRLQSTTEGVGEMRVIFHGMPAAAG